MILRVTLALGLTVGAGATDRSGVEPADSGGPVLPTKGEHATVAPPSPSVPQPLLEPGVPPGGYWDPGEAPESEPDDGEELLIAAYIVIPLGILGAVSGATMTYLTAPGHCPQRLAALGTAIDPGNCRGLFIYNAIQTTYGAAMAIAGFSLLGVGLHRRNRHRRWSRARFRGVSILPRSQGVSASFAMRF